MDTIIKVGIDPGLGGAIAAVTDKWIKVWDMPTKKIEWAVTTKYKTRIDGLKLFQIIDQISEMGEIESISIEIVGPKRDQGISSTGVFMGAFYSAIAIVEAMDYQPHMIRPAKWKAKYGLINMPKDMSRLICLKMFPSLAVELKRKCDVDRAEAILIAAST